MAAVGSEHAKEFSTARGQEYITIAKLLILLPSAWCREGESNPQGPKPGGF
jgi:hypothetical protein